MCHYCHAILVHFQFRPNVTLSPPNLHFVSFWFIFYAVYKALIKSLFTWNIYTNLFRSCKHTAKDFWIYWPKINYKNTDAYLFKTTMIDISFHWSNVMTVLKYDRANKLYDRSHWDRMYGTRRCPYLEAHCTWCGLISIHLPSTNFGIIHTKVEVYKLMTWPSSCLNPYESM